MGKAINFANKGQTLEEMIEISNFQYLQRGIAVIHKVPSKWIPIRKNGKVVSAKIEEKSIVDFIGRYGDTPIAFDAKSVLREDKWYLKNLEEHQVDFLRTWETDVALSFVLIGFWGAEEFFFCPFSYIFSKYVAWKKGGKASVERAELKEFKVVGKRGILLDYLCAV